MTIIPPKVKYLEVHVPNFLNTPVNKTGPVSALVECSQPATTANFEYSGSLAR